MGNEKLIPILQATRDALRYREEHQGEMSATVYSAMGGYIAKAADDFGIDYDDIKSLVYNALYGGISGAPRREMEWAKEHISLTLMGEENQRLFDAIADVIEERINQKQEYSREHDEKHGIPGLVELIHNYADMTLNGDREPRKALLAVAALAIAAIEFIDPEEEYASMPPLKVLGTETGRLNTASPNLANIPTAEFDAADIVVEPATGENVEAVVILGDEEVEEEDDEETDYDEVNAQYEALKAQDQIVGEAANRRNEEEIQSQVAETPETKPISQRGNRAGRPKGAKNRNRGR